MCRSGGNDVTVSNRRHYRRQPLPPISYI
jgi:hypothetical protein